RRRVSGAPRDRRGSAAAAAAPARQLAARVLERVETDAAFADLALEAETTRRHVAARDIGLATELIYGTLRWQRYLDWILAPRSPRGARSPPGSRRAGSRATARRRPRRSCGR